MCDNTVTAFAVMFILQVNFLKTVQPLIKNNNNLKNQKKPRMFMEGLFQLFLLEYLIWELAGWLV